VKERDHLAKASRHLDGHGCAKAAARARRSGAHAACQRLSLQGTAARRSSALHSRAGRLGLQSAVRACVVCLLRAAARWSLRSTLAGRVLKKRWASGAGSGGSVVGELSCVWRASCVCGAPGLADAPRADGRARVCIAHAHRRTLVCLSPSAGDGKRVCRCCARQCTGARWRCLCAARRAALRRASRCFRQESRLERPVLDAREEAVWTRHKVSRELVEPVCQSRSSHTVAGHVAGRKEPIWRHHPRDGRCVRSLLMAISMC